MLCIPHVMYQQSYSLWINKCFYISLVSHGHSAVVLPDAHSS